MPREPGFRTCPIKEHREEESSRKMRTRILKHKPRIDQASPDTEGVGRSRKKIAGYFSRRWTHNEQLMVRPCGMVIGRSTFYSSESMTAVKASNLISEVLQLRLKFLTLTGFHEKHLSRLTARPRARSSVFRQRVWPEEASTKLSRSEHSGQNGASGRRLPLRRPQSIP